jgi:LPXTG-motif cell wall-anchored protein
MKKIRLFATTLLIVGLLASNVFAAESDFVSSVESKEAPAVVEASKEVVVDGKKVTVDVVVTAASEADDEDTHEEISAALTAAKDDLKKVEKLEDLKSTGGGTIKEDLQKAIDTFNKSAITIPSTGTSTGTTGSTGSTGTTEETKTYTADDLVVTDLFDVSLVDSEGNIIEPDENNPVTLTFKTSFKSDDIVIVLHNKETGEWEVIDSDKVKVNDDGSVSVEFTSFSPIAFLSVVDDATADGNTDDTTTDGTKTDSDKTANKTDGTSTKVTSPQTGETANGYVVVASLMLLAAAAYCITRAKRTEC